MDRITLERIKPLLHQYLEGTLSEEERRSLEEWADAATENRALLQRISDPEQLQNDLKLLQQSNENIFARLKAGIPELLDKKTAQAPQAHRVHFLRSRFFRYAAAIVLIAGMAGWIWISSKQKKSVPDQTIVHEKMEIMPGGNKAILMLADGSSIVLDSAENGTIAQQGNTAIEKLSNGQIRYNNHSNTAATGINNTMRTPRGGQYQLILPDGTRVWLNAASSITYPVAFEKNERKVSITGEAYFETTKDPSKPFLVNTDGRSTIKVLGTSFNVNAYNNEQALITTLLEGAVQVQSKQQTVVLKPGQQSLQSGTDKISINSNADLEKALAWKNGRFDFNGLDLPSIMRQLERWYDINVEFTGPVSKETFKGRLTRDLTLSQVLDILGNMDVKYKLEGRKLILF
jgi:transmembrane sensor